MHRLLRLDIKSWHENNTTVPPNVLLVVMMLVHLEEGAQGEEEEKAGRRRRVSSIGTPTPGAVAHTGSTQSGLTDARNRKKHGWWCGAPIHKKG